MARRADSAALRWVFLTSFAVLAVAASSLFGPEPLPANAFSDSTSFYWQLRVPRTLLAAFAGAGLAVGGGVFQVLFRNPLATPYTLGIASGASLAAAIGFSRQLGNGYWLGVPRLSLLAFGGAMLAMGMVYLIARLRTGRDMTRLLLAGVCISYLSAAGVMLTTYLANRTITDAVVVWMMGSLAILRPQAAWEIALVLIPVLAFMLYCHRALDLLALGDDWAAARGVAVTRIVWGCFGLIGLLTAVIVANCGPIGFVGLMVPHLARAVIGTHALPLLLGSALLGAAFLSACDGVARSVLVSELPVGVVTNILGAVFFFYLLATRGAAAETPR